jgi:hypothetical protein
MKRFPMIVAVAGLCLVAATCQSPQQKIASKTGQTMPMYNWDWGPWTGGRTAGTTTDARKGRELRV